jgi:hypothetical protein
MALFKRTVNVLYTLSTNSLLGEAPVNSAALSTPGSVFAESKGLKVP